MKQIKVGDKFRGILTHDIVTVVYTHAGYCVLEYADKSLHSCKLAHISNSFEEIPVVKIRWFRVITKTNDKSPVLWFDCYKSKKHFLDYTGLAESEFEWISLKEIEYETTN